MILFDTLVHLCSYSPCLKDCHGCKGSTTSTLALKTNKDVMPFLCFGNDRENTVLVPGSWWKKSHPVEPNSRCLVPSVCAPGKKELRWKVFKSNRNGFAPQPASPSKPRQPCRQRPLCCRMRAGLQQEFDEVTLPDFGWSNYVKLIIAGSLQQFDKRVWLLKPS